MKVARHIFIALILQFCIPTHAHDLSAEHASETGLEFSHRHHLGGHFAQVEQENIQFPPAQRIVALGGSVTEIIYALGQQDRLVGVDQSSLYPAEAQSLSSVGYYRSVPVEGILRLKPDLVLASEQAGPSQVLAQLSALGIRVEPISDHPELTSLYTRIDQIARLLDVEEKGQLIRDDLEYKLSQSFQFSEDKPCVMMIVLRSGKLLGAGRETAANKVIELSSLTNMLNDFSGYRTISTEIVSAKQPDAMIVTSQTVRAMGGLRAVAQHAALRYTPAVANSRMVELDDMLAQGLGPRLPLAIETIRQGVFKE